jgi:ICP0-binding domain of Ubiquitin-specific protease 7
MYVLIISSELMVAIEGWLLKGSSSRTTDLRLYLERSDEIWHPTVAVLPKRTVPLHTPPPYVEDLKDSRSISSGHSSRSLSNGDIELDNTNGQLSQTVEWPEVGKLPGLYNARHDATMIMIFLKWFDVDSQRLRGQRTIYVNRHDKTGKLTLIVAEMMGWRAEPGEPPVNIAFYEEIKPGMIEPLKPNATFVGSEIQDGDIVCYMRAQSSKRYASLVL